MKTLRLKRDQNGKRKNYLTPRQHLFLNGSRLTLKGKKPIKTTLLRRISRFYRRKLRRMDISYFNPTLTVKNLKYKSSLLTLKKRSSQFTLKTLSDIKFNNIRFNMFKIIRRGKSRLKLRRTKKYYSYFNRILNINLISYLFTTILKHYRFSRVRYLNRFFRHHARRYKINTFGLFFRTLPSIPLFNSRNHLYDITITPSVLQEYFGSSYETFSTYPSNLEKLIQTKFETKLFKWAYFLFLWGIILFSGSLYFLCTRNLFNADWLKVLGPITPIGGVLFVAGWLCFAFVGLKNKLI